MKQYGGRSWFQSSSLSRVIVPLLCGLVLMLWLAPAPAPAQTPDDQYVGIYNVIQQADALTNKTAALKKYQQARQDLERLQRAYPNWNSSVVSFRLSYLDQQIQTLSSTEASPKPAAEDAGQAAPKAAATATDSVKIKLLEAGGEPRRALRLHPKAGDKQTMDMTMLMGIDMQFGQMPAQNMKLPPINMSMETTVKDVSADGEISYDMVITEAGIAESSEVTPQVADAMRSAFAGIKGLSGTGKLSNRGVDEGMTIKAGPNANPQMRQVMDQMKDSFSRMSSPLPEEPVGPGARWEVTTPIKSQGITLLQTATYTLTSLEDEHLSLDTTFSQSAANQKVESPSAPGVKVELVKMEGKGSGNRTSDLTRILPLSGKGTLKSDMLMSMPMGDQKQNMSMKMDMEITLTGK